MGKKLLVLSAIVLVLSVLLYTDAIPTLTTVFYMITRPRISHGVISYFNTAHVPSLKKEHMKRTLLSYDKQKYDFSMNKADSFMIMKDNKIIVEEYYNGYNSNSTFNYYSATKTVVSMCFGVLYDRGLVNLDDMVSKYIPEIKLQNTTIRNVLEMSSGMKGVQLHWLIDMGFEFYGYNLSEMVVNEEPDMTIAPGQYFRYKNLNTQIIGMIVEKVSGMKINKFFYENIWKYISTSEGEWCTDRVGNVKCFCCLYSNTEDFMRIGKLILDNGVVDGKHIISKKYLKMMATPDKSVILIHLNKTEEKNVFYGLQYWTMQVNGMKVDYFNGILGQITIIVKDWNMVITRFGHDYGLGRKGPTEEYVRNVVMKIKSMGIN